MAITDRLGRHRRSVVVAVVSNLFPLLGVFVLGWSAGPLLLFYWAEVGIAICWASFAALFAEKRSVVESRRFPLRHLSEKRGGRALWSGGPPAYLRNVPLAAGVFYIVGMWVASGFAIASVVEVEWTALPRWSLALGLLGVVVGRAVTFRSEYLGDEEYREQSARMVVAVPVRQVLALFVLGMGFGALERVTNAGTIGVVAVVLAKTGYELYEVHSRDGETWFLLDWVFGPRETAEPRAPVDVPDGDPVESVRTDRRAALDNSAKLSLIRLLGHFYGLVVLGVAVGLAWLVEGLVGAVVVGGGVLGLVAATLALYTASFLLIDGSIEYRRYDDALVAYDYLLDEAQWRLDWDDEPSVSDLTEGGSESALVSHPSESTQDRRLGPFDDARGAVSTLDLPIDERAVGTDEGASPDRTVAYAALGILGSFVALFGGLVLSGEVALGVVVILLIIIGPVFLFLTLALLSTAVKNW